MKLDPIDTVILSPHLDDAALSCGGSIYQQTEAGKRVLVVTFMAGDPPERPLSPYAQMHHTRWELASDVVERRRREDGVANNILGADYYHASIPDAIYRFNKETGDYFYTADNELFGKVHPTDAEQVLPLILTVLDQLPTTQTTLVPLTVGNHVDHQLVRTAVEQHPRKNLIYYEDYPYAREADAVESVIANDRLTLEYETESLSEKALQAKGESIAAFESQISSFFNGRSDIDAQINAYASKVGGERYWRATA